MIEFILSFIFGLLIGSFINCVVYRVYNKKSFLKGRSMCPECNHKLGFFDLIPILSFLSLKGKCRYCEKSISKQYLLVEFFTGLIFFLVAYFLNANFLMQGIFTLNFLELLFYWFVASYFIMIFIFDVKWFIIPDGLNFSATIITLIWLFIGTFNLGLYSEQELLARVITAFIVFLLFFALYFFSDGKAMGFGDVKLVVFLGLLLGFPNILPALFIAFALGAVIGLIMILFKKKRNEIRNSVWPIFSFRVFCRIIFWKFFSKLVFKFNVI